MDLPLTLHFLGVFMVGVGLAAYRGSLPRRTLLLGPILLPLPSDLTKVVAATIIVDATLTYVWVA
jgi:hypothetical protein